MMVILTFSILWLSGESDDGDFDFIDTVTDWGRLGVLKWKQDQKNLLMNSFYSDGFDYIGL